MAAAATAWRRVQLHHRLARQAPSGSLASPIAFTAWFWLIGAAKRAATGIYLRLRIIEVASVAVVASSFKARRRLADAAEIEQHAVAQDTPLDTPLTAPPPADTMAETRPLVTVYGADGAATGASVPLPGVFAARSGPTSSAACTRTSRRTRARPTPS